MVKGNDMMVKCPECGEWHTPDTVKALNIEEDHLGRDVLTFECPETNKITRAIIHVR